MGEDEKRRCDMKEEKISAQITFKSTTSDKARLNKEATEKNISMSTLLRGKLFSASDSMIAIEEAVARAIRLRDLGVITEDELDAEYDKIRETAGLPPMPR